MARFLCLEFYESARSIVTVSVGNGSRTHLCYIPIAVIPSIPHRHRSVADYTENVAALLSPIYHGVRACPPVSFPTSPTTVPAIPSSLNFYLLNGFLLRAFATPLSQVGIICTRCTKFDPLARRTKSCTRRTFNVSWLTLRHLS